MSRITRRRQVIAPLALLAAAAMAMAGCGSSSGSSGASGTSPIVACGDLALSGPYAQIGQTDNWGASAFFKHVDATGGILGHKVTYITVNNGSSASQSELIARKCILSDHASFIIGPESGADTESALPLAISYHTILISLSSGWQTNGYPASELNSWGFPGFYDVFYNDQLASVQQLIVPRHYTRVALLEDNCGSVCLANKGSVQALAAKYGFQLVSTQIDQVGATDVTPQVLAMLAAKPQIILFGLVPGTDSITAIRGHPRPEPDDPDQRVLRLRAAQLHLRRGRALGDEEHLRARLDGGLADRRRAGHRVAGAADRRGPEGVLRRHARRRLHQRQPARQQPGRLGRRAGGPVGDQVRRHHRRDRGHAQAPAPGHQHAGHRVGRTPSNYENISQVLAAMEIINSDGSATLYKG